MTTWKNWFADFVQDLCAQPRHYADPFPTAAHFVSPHLYEENRIADDGFDRNLVLGFFGLSGYCLVSDGTVATCQTVDCNMTSLISILYTCSKDLCKGLLFAQRVSKTVAMLDGYLSMGLRLRKRNC